MEPIYSQIRQGHHSSSMTSDTGSHTQKHPRPLPRPRIYRPKYASLPVAIPESFLSPIPPKALSDVTCEKIDFGKTALVEYHDHYALIVDSLLTQEECDQLIQYAEMSAGGHGNLSLLNGDASTDTQNKRTVTFHELTKKKSIDDSSEQNSSDDKGSGVEDDPAATIKPDGWHRALVRTGANREMISLQHRNSDRIVWNEQDVATRIWMRVWQVKGVRDVLGVLEGEEYASTLGEVAVERAERWKVSQRGLNESLKFLRYEGGGYFREHCDGTYETPDATQRSFFTIHLYLNSSSATTSSATTSSPSSPSSTFDDNHPRDLLIGGATTFHSRDLQHRLDVHPKVGRVLLFQQRGLLHSGEEVMRGVKFTMRSDVMYEFDDDGEEEGGEGGVVFG